MRVKALAARADARWAAAAAPAAGGDVAGPAADRAAPPALEGSPMGGRETGGAEEVKGEGEGEGEGGVSADRKQSWRKMQEEEKEKAKAAALSGAPGASSGAAADPWKRAARGGPSEEWQPKGWDPAGASKR